MPRPLAPHDPSDPTQALITRLWDQLRPLRQAAETVRRNGQQRLTIASARLAQAQRSQPRLDALVRTRTRRPRQPPATPILLPELPPGTRPPGARVVQTDWLVMPPSWSFLYLDQGSGFRDALRANMASRRYDAFALVIYNRDASFGSNLFYDFVDRPNSGRLHQRLNELRAAAFDIWMGIGFEDSKAGQKKYPPSTLINQYLGPLIQAIDSKMRGYWLGIEVNEYWSTAEVERIGRALRGHTRKPIYVHYQKGRWSGRHGQSDAAQQEWWRQQPWLTGLMYQYGKDHSTAFIERETLRITRLLHPLGKLFLANEYAVGPPHGEATEAEAVRLGDAAMRGGADGFLNGGTAL